MRTTEQLQQLEAWQQIVYGTALIERMYPNYALFAELTDTGGSTVFRNILNLIWESASGKNQRIDFQKQLDKLESITPDPEQFDMYGVWPALDATVGLSSLLSACQRWEPSEIAAIETLSRATIEHYLQASNSSNTETPSLLEVDWAYRDDVLTLISSNAKRSRVELIAGLKTLVAEYGVSNIGLEIS